MDLISVIAILCFPVLSWVLLLYKRSTKLHHQYPPGPKPFPIIGNIHQLGRSPHKSLAKLANKHGPIMFLKLGSLRTVVVSSPHMAKQILHKHDLSFDSRTLPAVGEVLPDSILFLQVANERRKLRKIISDHLFLTPRVNSTRGLRKEKLDKLRDYVRECSHSGKVVDIGEAAFVTALNNTSGMLFSVDFGNYDSGPAIGFKGIVREMLEVIGTPNVADFFPILKMIDPQRIQHKSRICYGKLLAVAEDFINQRSQSQGGVSAIKHDLLQVLLDRGRELELSSDRIKYLFVDLFLAGTDTSAATIEWAMAELLRNPENMSKVKHELFSVVGENNEVEEDHIPRLTYLQAVIKETLRCHPPAPLLVPRKAEVDIEIDGYVVPKNSQVMVNVWAIGRSPSVWPNPESFEPERFLEMKMDYMGNHFELTPFGSGRRMCPAVALAHRLVHLMLATLIHGFDWKLEEGMTPDRLDLDERFGLTLVKAVPLKAIPVLSQGWMHSATQQDHI